MIGPMILSEVFDLLKGGIGYSAAGAVGVFLGYVIYRIVMFLIDGTLESETEDFFFNTLKFNKKFKA